MSPSGRVRWGRWRQPLVAATGAAIAMAMAMGVAMGVAACAPEPSPHPLPPEVSTGLELARAAAMLAPLRAVPAPWEPPPPPAGPPEMADLLDAATAGPVPLPDEVRIALRRAQAAAGDLPALVPDPLEAPRTLLAMADAAMALPAHGIAADRVPEGAVARLGSLAEDIAATELWLGAEDPSHDRTLAALLVEADHRLVQVGLAIARALGADHPLPAASRDGRRLALVGAMAAWSDTAGRRTGVDGLSELVATFPPPLIAYERLAAAHDRYAALVAHGGFEALPKRGWNKARPGRTHKGIPALRRRLAQEAPDPTRLGELTSNAWDDALTEALRAARDAHQLKQPRKDRNLIDKKLLAALAVPADARLAQLRLDLERLRRSPKRHLDYAVWVNVPDFHGEVWDGSERLRRFKVVVGGARKTDGKRLNATPELTSFIDRVVFNPFWTVPRRIIQEELVRDAQQWAVEQAAAAAPKPSGPTISGSGTTIPGASPPPARATVGSIGTVAAGAARAAAPTVDPSGFWEAKGYDVKGDGDVPRWVRRRPGPGNALGKVKFVFDNRHSVFLHDTPAKRKFRHTRRAFSHGCVRVHEPVELARLLLERDGTWDVARRRRVLKHYENTPISLRRRVPIVLDYVTTRVADDGWVHWLGDVYGKGERDRARLLTVTADSRGASAPPR